MQNCPDEVLDLHGHTWDQAAQAISQTIYRLSRSRTTQTLLIDAGKGKHSGEGGPVLRPNTRHLLDLNGFPFQENYGRFFVTIRPGHYVGRFRNPPSQSSHRRTRVVDADELHALRVASRKPGQKSTHNWSRATGGGGNTLYSHQAARFQDHAEYPHLASMPRQKPKSRRRVPPQRPTPAFFDDDEASFPSLSDAASDRDLPLPALISPTLRRQTSEEARKLFVLGLDASTAVNPNIQALADLGFDATDIHDVLYQLDELPEAVQYECAVEMLLSREASG